MVSTVLDNSRAPERPGPAASGPAASEPECSFECVPRATVLVVGCEKTPLVTALEAQTLPNTLLSNCIGEAPRGANEMPLAKGCGVGVSRVVPVGEVERLHWRLEGAKAAAR